MAGFVHPLRRLGSSAGPGFGNVTRFRVAPTINLWVMGDAAWRVRVQFATDEDADRFLAWWKGSTLATSEGSEPSGDGSLKFFYVGDRAHAVELASALLPELSALPIATGSVNVDQWLMDERRWSDESLLADDEDMLRGALAAGSPQQSASGRT